MLGRQLFWLVAAAAALLRLGLAVVVPLTDTTEARFGEMARKMVESGDWLVPLHDYGVPYLAKPPLALWFCAAGIELFGAGELGPRIFVWAASVVFVIWLHAHVRRRISAAAAATTVFVLSTSVLFFLAAAAAMTDMLLTIAVTVALGAFWSHWKDGAARNEIALYVALGLGLLVKGPIAAVLTLGPIIVWSVATGQAGTVWRRFAWLKGALLALAIALPWYVAAELRNPGFLRYFIVGEHLSRFLVPGWSGDLYGRAHDVPRGTVLLFFVVGLLPWSLVLAAALWRARGAVGARWRENRELVSFWVIAAAAPLLLFAVAGNVIFPYALPALPAAAIALAALLHGDEVVAERRGTTLVALAAAGVVAVAAAVALPLAERHSQRVVVAAAEQREAAEIYYWQRRFFSAEYYSAGRARVLRDDAALAAVLDSAQPFELVVETRRIATLPRALVARLRRVADIGEMSLFEPSRPAGT